MKDIKNISVLRAPVLQLQVRFLFTFLIDFFHRSEAYVYLFFFHWKQPN